MNEYIEAALMRAGQQIESLRAEVARLKGEKEELLNGHGAVCNHAARLTQQLASLKEERDNLKLQYTNARHSQWSSEVNAIDEIHSLTQQLAAANGRVEKYREALGSLKTEFSTRAGGTVVFTREKRKAIIDAALSDLPEADKEKS